MEFDAELLQSTLLDFKPNYHKLLIINLTTDNYKPIIIADDEWSQLRQNKSYKISEYWEWFVCSPYIHDDDRKEFAEFVRSDTVNRFFIYRRLFNSEWHWVLMKILPSRHYAPDNKECVLSVQDINSIYNQEYEQVADMLGTTDPLTTLFNKVAFERDINRHTKGFVGIVFADINGLKYTNDTYGHSEGDRLIKDFAKSLRATFKDYRCYHISGDEFIVAGFDIKVHEFLNKVLSFHKSLWDGDNTPPAALGYSAGVPMDVKEIIEYAEKSMYEDKQKFYEKYPHLRRK